MSVYFIGLFYPDAIRNKTKIHFDIKGIPLRPHRAFWYKRAGKRWVRILFDEDAEAPERTAGSLTAACAAATGRQSATISALFRAVWRSITSGPVRILHRRHRMRGQRRQFSSARRAGILERPAANNRHLREIPAYHPARPEGHKTGPILPCTVLSKVEPLLK
ncbi:hypothetical protein [Klebsiella pneumoniae]|uniref:hypothetical protein n=1 Tax=Klebsiella pneumoniae TaxID=573 RepID=UPI0022F3F81B|nr:hypothetical protein [Klebsiella pneumoniae]WBY15315.1 hypothetical protein DLD89_28000 [Klebsiella pneumoniae subsp. pneumoniae]